MSVKNYLRIGIRYTVKGVPEVKTYPKVLTLTPSELLKVRVALNIKIGIMVNNAGQWGGYISKATLSEYNDIMETNAKRTFFLTRLVAKYMINEWVKGNILNISSASSLRPALSAYHMSKWAILGLTMCLARCLAPHGIVANAIAPGPTATPMLMSDDIGGDVSHSRILLGRYALPA